MCIDTLTCTCVRDHSRNSVGSAHSGPLYKSTTPTARNVAFDFLCELFDFYVFPQS